MIAYRGMLSVMGEWCSPYRGYWAARSVPEDVFVYTGNRIRYREYQRKSRKLRIVFRLAGFATEQNRTAPKEGE